MRSQVVVAAVALFLHGCDQKSPPAKQEQPKATSELSKPIPAIPLGDLSTSLAAARTEFNAHKGEARFLMLLSPT